MLARMNSTPQVLVIVDVQNDFCPGGALATSRGDAVARGIAKLVREASYDVVVATQDWHIEPEGHFATEPDFIDTWPVHCVAGSQGAAMHAALADAPIDAYFHKGAYTAAYSGFEAECTDDGASLAQWLRDRGVKGLDIVGIATDHCVRATALDALKEGFGVNVLENYCAPVSEERAKKDLCRTARGRGKGQLKAVKSAPS